MFQPQIDLDEPVARLHARLPRLTPLPELSADLRPEKPRPENLGAVEITELHFELGEVIEMG